ncbi:hypothetical protein [Paenibacillus nasutitermitis]|uniref:Uncharacterized protein n=1 Tax=Paenibacillus nasutitermitis TaxID=1652958 RepID=A0A916Z3Z4_9BACL|nr:hypothetical protein [Paenibacillus nasutitermitis]GGD75036.1 hypothetical protein GCM10010911_36180 [Paenibacillus nasutitermitis]
MRHETVMTIDRNQQPIRLRGFQLSAGKGFFISIVAIMSLPQAMYFDPAWALLFAVVFLLVYPRRHRSIYTRMMWISSSRGDALEEAIQAAVGRQVTRIPAGKSDESKQRMKLLIYRLEERMLKDLVRSIDPEAVCRIMPFYEWKGEGRQDLR